MKKPVFKTTAYLLCVLGIVYTVLYYLSYLPFTPLKSKISAINLVPELQKFVLFTQGCKVPKYDPFDKTILEYYKNISGDIECSGKSYLNVVNNKVILDKTHIQKDFKGKKIVCTYRSILRNPNNDTSRADNKFEYSKEKMLKFGEDLPSEFVKVFCRTNSTVVYEEFLASTPLKPQVEERCEKSASKRLTKTPLNIIVVGIDSISKLNFERHFKTTSEFVRNNLKMFEFHGYMKVADNTFPNLTPMLTGHFIKHYYTSKNKDRYFDDLDFIWKNFSVMGYRTLLAEDAPDMATYNYVKNGFQFPPTDYFFRPFTIAIEDTPWHKRSKVDCLQAKPEIKVLFDYLRSFLSTMESRPYFAFTWAARLTHGKLNKAGLADKPAFELLSDIKNMGLLNKSMLIFMSDHGIRFGGIRKTYIGKVEERMPFLFISFPPWFLQAYPKIAQNLELNQYRLTTPFDIHETFVDLYQMMSNDYNYSHTPYGISLFKEIPVERNCNSAFILPHWCVCHDYHKIPSKDASSRKVANILLEAVNNITKPYRDSCAELKLSSIIDVRVSKPIKEMLTYSELERAGDEKSVVFDDSIGSHLEYQVTLQAEPGGAEFESTLQYIKEAFKLGDISRINKYGNQGDCIDDSEMRKYCFCLKSGPV
ncbi:uncharacterized protein LOC118198414 [Stegodyphus dumicola]|uniref:uncharacterized protein LOC118198414 n=1 Tax=Stegodyphus dumicola TaxID=202533 RepID=UPI0015AB5F1F|nr:uncharacterized protein LOC118198414 [Stegodyphus dumicola]XP_035225968.1 uncharacterized protein LOC118198414 [Stegodyphus dumicola]XP_035225969.1 uncharacterized protein LOC118198414 [Stegodyphus dumicola]XP_035225970.1 uncharacterized protein LOC118198414 [Stegodyphus dumicola]